MKKYKLEIEVPVCEDKKGTFSVRYQVKGMMTTIKRTMSSKDQQDMLDEYAKFYIMDKLGVKIYPEEK